MQHFQILHHQIKTVKYKTMILTVNSKSYLNSREKMNKMLEKYKIEISN